MFSTLTAQYRTTIRCIAGITGLAILTACSGGGSGSASPIGPQSDSLAQVQFIMTRPTVTPQSGARTPEYISPATKSFSILVDGSGVPTITNLSPPSSACSTASGQLKCTINLKVPAGTHGFVIKTFDALDGGGNVLSQATVPGVTVVKGVVTTVPVILGGVIASVVIGLSNSSPITGTAASIDVTVSAKDASGNTIVGNDTYTNPINLTDSDASGATALSPVVVTKPSTTVKLAYTGSPSVGTATISANVAGLTPTAITPATLTPISTSSGGSEAIVIVTQGGTTNALVPVSTGLAIVPVAHGTTLAGIKRSAFVAPKSVATAHLPDSQSDQRSVAASFRQKLALRRGTEAAPVSSVISVSPAPNECASNDVTQTAYCINYGSNVVTKIDLKALTQTASYSTDATTSLGFSGGGCVICGIVYDSRDSAFIIGTGQGYEVHKASDGTLIKTIGTTSAENFGYNPVTNRILSPEYDNGPARVALLDVASGAEYVPQSPIAGLNAPDAAAFDSSTNIGVVPEEFTHLFYTIDFTGATLTPPSGTNLGTFSSAVVSTPITSTAAGIWVTDIAVDSGTHLAFSACEFGQEIGAVQLPTTGGGAAALGDYVFTALPPTPDGSFFQIPGDPHATANFNLSGTGLGFTFNSSETYLAVVDLKKLLAAPRLTGDPHSVDPSYDLVANGVVHYNPI